MRALPAAFVGSPVNGVVLRHLKWQIQEISRIVRTNKTISSWLLHIVDANGWCRVRGREAMRRSLGARARTGCFRASCQSKQHDAEARAAGQRSSGVEPPHGNHAACMLFKASFRRRLMQCAGAGEWRGAAGQGTAWGFNPEFTETWYRFRGARGCSPPLSQVGSGAPQQPKQL